MAKIWVLIQYFILNMLTDMLTAKSDISESAVKIDSHSSGSFESVISITVINGLMRRRWRAAAVGSFFRRLCDQPLGQISLSGGLIEVDWLTGNQRWLTGEVWCLFVHMCLCTVLLVWRYGKFLLRTLVPQINLTVQIQSEHTLLVHFLRFITS